MGMMETTVNIATAPDGRLMEGETMSEPEGNELISMEQFEAISARHSSKRSPEAKVLMALNPGTAIVFKEHGGYKCKGKSCGLRTLAAAVAKRRGLIYSSKHLQDGRISVAFYANGAQ